MKDFNEKALGTPYHLGIARSKGLFFSLDYILHIIHFTQLFFITYWFNTLSVLSKGFVSSVNAIAIAENVLLFVSHSLRVSAILIALLNFARGLLIHF